MSEPLSPPPPGAQVMVRDGPRKGERGRVVRLERGQILVAFQPDERVWFDPSRLDWWVAPLDRAGRRCRGAVDANRSA